MLAKNQDRAAAVLGDPRWTAIVTRDSNADDAFFYSVITTGVFCRPSCPSRASRPEHVAFHDSAAAAARAGFRPCQRCKPTLPPARVRQAADVARLCRIIENSDEPLSLEALARHAGFSTFHTHRLFKAITGVTPAAYAAAHRNRRMRRALTANSSVTAAIYDAGYASNGRFYEAANRTLGMTPSAFRKGAPGERIHFAFGTCSLGLVLVAATARGVCAVTLGDDRDELARDLKRRFPRADLYAGDAAFDAAIAQIFALIESPRAGLSLPLDVRGTAFQQRVWRALQDIAAGDTASYTEIAARIGVPKASRAVAAACAANPVAVAIPCHRVLRANGDVSGYRWGVDRKRALLARESKK